MQYSEIISEIKSNRNPEAVAGMARFGINETGGWQEPLTQAQAPSRRSLRQASRLHLSLLQ
jgi:hypothetical protein